MPIPEALGQVSPRDARTKTIQDRFDKEAIVSGSHTHFPWLPRQSQLLEFLPLIVTQGIPLFHASYFTERDTLFENTAYNNEGRPKILLDALPPTALIPGVAGSQDGFRVSSVESPWLTA
jgi:hypothetical protein